MPYGCLICNGRFSNPTPVIVHIVKEHTSIFLDAAYAPLASRSGLDLHSRVYANVHYARAATPADICRH